MKSYIFKRPAALVANLLIVVFVAPAFAAQTSTTQSAPRTPPPNAAPRTPAQKPATPNPNARPAAMRPAAAPLDFGGYGVRIAPDPRLFAVMGALLAAGFETPNADAASTFARDLRAANAALDASLRTRLRDFYQRNRLPGDAAPAQQAARYVSLAFALGDAPDFSAPARSDDLPGGVLDVLDFAALVREHYRATNAADLLAAYTREAQTAGDRLRPGTAEMLRTVLSRFRVRPVLTTFERTLIETPTTKNKKKNAQAFATRERERRFQIVPDPLAVPGTVNLRVIGDDYFVVLPPTANPASAELRRAYIQFLVDPLTRRFNREIALRRPEIAGLLTAQNTAAPDNLPASTTSVFEAFTRSLVAAVDARVTESTRLAGITNLRAQPLADARRRIADARAAALSDAYERGGVLAFYLAEQLDGIDSSGFEVTNLLPDIINSFDPARESRRLAEASDARTRDRDDARRRAAETAAETAAARAAIDAEAIDPARAALLQSLAGIGALLRAGDYPRAEEQARALLAANNGDARIFFALAQAASLGAEDATDENVQLERLRRALANYRLSIQAADPEADRALLSRAHTAAGRIHAFIGEQAEAEAAFASAIKLGEVSGGALREAEAELTKLRGSRP